MTTNDALRARIAQRVSEGYRVVSETPTSAQLVRPKRFNAAEFVAMPIYLIEYLGQRERQVYIAVDDRGNVSETGSGTEMSRYRRAQGLSGAMRLAWVVGGFILLIVIALVWQAAM